MASGGSAIRGSRVGAGPMGEQYRGYRSERVQRNYYCINGHSQNPQFAAHIDPAEIPELIDCPNCGLPAGQDQKNPPQIIKHEPYKTHLAYVKERRSRDEAKALLEEALYSIKERRARIAETAKKQLKLEATRTIAAKAQAVKLAAEKAKAAKAVKPKLVKAAQAKPAKPNAKKPVVKKPAAKVTNSKKTVPVKLAKKIGKTAPKSKNLAKGLSKKTSGKTVRKK